MADKTQVPGVEENNATSFSERRSLRNPKSLNSPTGEGTVTPDAGEVPSDFRAGRSSFVNKGKPIFGFLYSVSKTAFGEFWPLYIGPNTIGRVNSDITLEEGTVSEDHAVITIHQDEETREVYASIADEKSTHGVRVNGKNIRFDRVECKNMDIIKIGMNYELLFFLVDTGSLNLKPAENFVEISKKATKEVGSRIISGPKSRLNNSENNDRTRSLDSEEELGGGTRTR